MAQEGARGLGAVDASLIVVGSIVGAGIFLVSPSVAHEVRSPAAFLATWLLGGAVALSGALSNGELGGLFPRSGGEYVYLREAYGPPLGFLSGWMAFWIAFPGSIAALATGFGATLAPMLGLDGTDAPKAIGVVAVGALTVVNALGMRSGKWLQNALSITKLAAFAVLLGLGLLVPRQGSGSPSPLFAPGDQPGGIATALVSVMFAYSGWNAATYVAGEMRDPTRGLGRALGAIAARCLSPLVAVSILSSLQATVLVGPRIYQAMANDGLFFAPLGRAHPSTGAPVVSLAVQAVVSAALLWVERFDQLLSYAMFAIVAFSTLAVAAVFVLRVRRPDVPRPFRVPGYPFVPGLFVIASAWMLWNVLAHGERREMLRGCAILATGVPAYVAFRAYGRLRARMDQQEKAAR